MTSPSPATRFLRRNSIILSSFPGTSLSSPPHLYILSLEKLVFLSLLLFVFSCMMSHLDKLFVFSRIIEKKIGFSTLKKIITNFYNFYIAKLEQFQICNRNHLTEMIKMIFTTVFIRINFHYTILTLSQIFCLFQCEFGNLLFSGSIFVANSEYILER